MEIDYKAFLKMVKSGAHKSEICGKFEIKPTQFNNLVVQAFENDGTIPETVRARKKATKEISREVSIKKRGSLIIPKNLIADLGFQEGDIFLVKKSTKGGITLSKIHTENVE